MKLGSIGETLAVVDERKDVRGAASDERPVDRTSYGRQQKTSMA